MAREESSREDLLREATALIERIELVPRTTDSISTASGLSGTHIVAGFRRNGALSLFFGEEPVYQFNAAGELRRAYCNGKLLKANRGRLAALERLRTEHEVQLIRHDLSNDEQSAVLTDVANRIREFAILLNESAFELKGQVPLNVDVLSRLKQWFSAHNFVQIAQRPNA